MISYFSATHKIRLKKGLLFTIIVQALCLYSTSCSLQNDRTIKVSIEKLNSNSQLSIRALSVVNENIIWAGASEGSILKSIDGGLNWEIFKIGTDSNNDFRSLHAWSDKEAIAFGVAGPNFGYKTLNGGETWELVYQDTTRSAFFNSIIFANDSVGLAVSDAIDDQLYLIKTIDRGATWKRVLNTPQQQKGEFNFAASNTCIEFLPSGKAWIASGGSVARVFYSNDFGETWKVSNTPMIFGDESSGIFSIDFINEQQGVIVGGTYDQPEKNKDIAAYTNDGGLNWNLASSMPAEFRSCVQFIEVSEQATAIAIGKTGIDYSNDFGKNWNFIDSTQYFTFRAVQNKNVGFAAGPSGNIAKITFHSTSK